MDSIPKEGGNNFSGIWRTFGSSGSLQNSNITDELRPFIKEGTRLDFSYETNAVFGGPIKRDRLWFLVAQRISQTNNIIPLPTQYFPQGGTAESGGKVAPHSTVRLTYQASARNKVMFAFYKSQGGTQRFDVGCTATSGNTVSHSPEAAYWLPTPPIRGAGQVDVAADEPPVARGRPVAGSSDLQFKYQPENGPYAHFNRTTACAVASSTAPNDYFNEIRNLVTKPLYVTGTHNIKGGINRNGAGRRSRSTARRHVPVDLVNNAAGVATPTRPCCATRPSSGRTSRRPTWACSFRTNGRSAASRSPTADATTTSTATRPERQRLAATFQRGTRTKWTASHAGTTGASASAPHTISFGAARAALKTSVGKFLAQQALGTRRRSIRCHHQTDTRGWTDRDGNGSVLDANGNPQFNELGASTNNNLAIPGGGTKIADGLPRATNWEESVSVSTSFSRVSVTGGCYRRQFYEAVTNNRALVPIRDFTPFTAIVPANVNLPGGGNYPVTLYNRSSATTGVNDNYLSWSTANTRVYNGIEFSLNARRGVRSAASRPSERRPTTARTCELEPEHAVRSADQLRVRSGAAVPDALQGVGRVRCLRYSDQRLVPGSARHQPRGRLHLHVQCGAGRRDRLHGPDWWHQRA
jgi:hypothetical protein